MSSVSSLPVQRKMYVSSACSLPVRSEMCRLCVHFLHSEKYIFCVFTSCAERNICLLCVHFLYGAKCVFCVFTSCTEKCTSSVRSLPVRNEIYVSSEC